MTTRAITYVEIARDQLEEAISLYFKGAKYVSAITLAGAAEEILGKMVKHTGKKNVLHERVELYLDLNEIFPDLRVISREEVVCDAVFSRNSAKHLDHSVVTAVVFYDKENAEDQLERAIRNYEILHKELSPEMSRFREAMQDAV